MSSRRASVGDFRRQLVERFLSEYDLDHGLVEPLLGVFQASSLSAPTIVREPMVPEPDTTLAQGLEHDSESAHPTMSAVFDDETSAPSDTANKQPSLQQVEMRSLEVIGRGGMGEVHRASDEFLHRLIAMKVLHDRYVGDPGMRARFLAEAQITAQLAHPSIPPVHSVGELLEGMPFFTMKEVHGDTLSTVIRQVHEGEDDHHWTQTRLLGVFQKVCEAVAYAHARGVIHGDLKPANIMVGAFGEVLVMDWGVARLVPSDPNQDAGLEAVSLGPGAMTIHDAAIAGTPSYMPPEQALAQGARIGPPADVYALGVVLFELLCGFRPYRGTQVQLLVQAAAGKIPPMETTRGEVVHDGLRAIVEKAMDPDPDSRYATAGHLAEDIARWLEGSIRRERALAEVRAANQRLSALNPVMRRAKHLREQADDHLRRAGPEAAAQEKASAWKLDDEADRLEREGELSIAEIVQKLNAALAQAPDLREAHDLLARIHLEQHRKAEKQRDHREAARLEVLLRAHDSGAYAPYLAGTAALTLLTDVSAEATLHRMVERDRQLVSEPVSSIGTTPIVTMDLPTGSYCIELLAEGRVPVRYPVVLGRMKPWVPQRPGVAEPSPVYLPHEGELAEGEVYVCAGWTTIGGDPDAIVGVSMQRLWVPGFTILRDPVTNREFFEFLSSASPSAVIARRDFCRSSRHLVRPNAPVVGVSWRAACAYAEWRAERDGKSWRLPTEVEWEKAARGVDARFHPWGDFFDASFARVRAGAMLPQFPGVCEEQVLDISPYGVRGMAGNVREWCLDPFYIDRIASAGSRTATMPELNLQQHQRAVRGGSWNQPPTHARAASRAGRSMDAGYPDIGLRLARTLPSD